jgi:hypothetical protein
MGSSVSIAKVGEKKCKPFLLEVKVVAPEAGYRFEVIVEKGCTSENDPIWKLVFDLYRKIDGKFEEIVHVSFRAGTEEEQQGIKKIAENGLSKKAAAVLKSEVFPVAKNLEKKEPTDKQRETLKTSMSKATRVDL